MKATITIEKPGEPDDPAEVTLTLAVSKDEITPLQINPPSVAMQEDFDAAIRYTTRRAHADILDPINEATSEGGWAVGAQMLVEDIHEAKKLMLDMVAYLVDAHYEVTVTEVKEDRFRVPGQEVKR